MENKVSKTISKYKMVKHGEKIAVGVSGGKDSLSLLYIMKKSIEAHPSNGNELVAVTVDEGIEGYRSESLEIVAKVCNDLNVKSQVVSYESLFGLGMDEAMVRRPSEKHSSCSICGTFRRRALDLACEKVGADVLATAHNLDDHLQTFMINILAGDVERIGWTNPASAVTYGRGIRKIKPLTEIPEYEIAFYALQRGLPFQVEECPYMNESIRSDIRGFFNSLETKHPGIKHNAYNSMIKMASGLAHERTERSLCSVCHRDSSGPVCSVCRTSEMLLPATSKNMASDLLP